MTTHPAPPAGESPAPFPTRLLRAFTIVSVVGAMTGVRPCPVGAQGEGDVDAGDHRVPGAIATVLDRMVGAWNRDDLAGHIAPYAEDATYTTGDGVRRGRTAVREILDGFVQPDGLAGELRFEDLLHRSLGDAHALVTGRFRLDFRDGRSSSGRFSLLFERRDGRWVVIHDHSS